ncbi:OB-fold nucleic acid binding domain-containing protein [Exiguobacterium undae]|uniref:OB domain-containing protein n=1 Tax=Exiguobacterium undae TaxID=169177 RepID=A0ABX2V837_9BACL|nr:OB-fold nucleic acid binding domain-containing protein [Exiguobacterium undae]OAN14378.1 hypothetical protein A3783_00190 [Exiguobacterium undae]
MKQSKGMFIGLTVCILVLLVGGAIYKLNLFGNETAKETSEVQSAESDKATKDSDIMSISSITEEMKGQQKKIIGTVTERSTSKGHVFLKVNDDSGTISVPIFKDKGIDSSMFMSGKTVAVTGNVDVYQGKIEVVPQTEQDLIMMESNQTEQITSDDVGQTKTVSAKIISKYVHPKGHIFLTVESTNGQTLKVPLFVSLKPDSSEYPVHATATIKGKVTEYKGELELVPAALQDVTLTNKTAETIKTRTLSSIQKSDRGSQVIVEGMVEQVTEKNDHLFFQLTQDNKQIKSVLFKADSQEIKGRKERIENAMVAQFPIRVMATVDIYQDELELIIDKVLVD